MAKIGHVYGYGQLADGKINFQTAVRCWKAYDLYSKREIEKIAITVGVGINGISMAHEMANFLVNLGVAREKILIDPHGWNTAGEIDILIKHLIDQDQIIVISNLYHLFRIRFLWKVRGFTVWTAPTFGGESTSDLLLEPLKWIKALLFPRSSAKVYCPGGAKIKTV